jgi:hypothetical protein
MSRNQESRDRREAQLDAECQVRADEELRLNKMSLWDLIHEIVPDEPMRRILIKIDERLDELEKRL